jgi:hypothetical protein
MTDPKPNTRLRGVLAALALLERTRDGPGLLAHLTSGLRRHLETPRGEFIAPPAYQPNCEAEPRNQHANATIPKSVQIMTRPTLSFGPSGETSQSSKRSSACEKLRHPPRWLLQPNQSETNAKALELGWIV